NGIFCSGLLQSDQRIINDSPRIFTARIVRRKHDKVTSASRCFSHHRTFRPVAISSATKDGKYAPLCSSAGNELTRQSGQIAQRIISVGIVDNHGEWLATIHTLKSARNVR